MAEVNPPVFLQAGSHPAEDVRRALQSLLRSDGSGVEDVGDLLVSATSPESMAVTVAPGAAWVFGSEGSSQGVYFVRSDDAVVLPIQAAHPVSPRVDQVVARVRDTAYSGIDDDWILEVVPGTPGVGASTLPDNAILLATVTVPAQATEIQASAIVDERPRLTLTFDGPVDFAEASVTDLVADRAIIRVPGSTPATPVAGGLSAFRVTVTDTGTSAVSVAGRVNANSVVVAGVATVGSTLTVTGNVDINGTLTTVRSLTVEVNLSVAGSASVDGNLDVDGSTTLDNTTIDGNLNVNEIPNVGNTGFVTADTVRAKHILALNSNGTTNFDVENLPRGYLGQSTPTGGLGILLANTSFPVFALPTWTFGRSVLCEAWIQWVLVPDSNANIQDDIVLIVDLCGQPLGGGTTTVIRANLIQFPANMPTLTADQDRAVGASWRFVPDASTREVFLRVRRDGGAATGTVRQASRAMFFDMGATT